MRVALPSIVTIPLFAGVRSEFKGPARAGQGRATRSDSCIER